MIDERSRAHVLTALAPQLPAHLLGRALRGVLAVRDVRGQAEALAALAPRLSEAQRARSLEKGAADHLGP